MRTTPEEHSQMARASAWDDEIAAERGRLFAAHCILEGGPEKRREMEDMLGKSYCMMRWPEIYGKGDWKPVIDFIPGLGEVPK